uniref:Transthyretin-like family protein n=1 Tax=Globodera rostochiensis TaxID=31243 RepID=A0A914HY46_GLORO
MVSLIICIILLSHLTFDALAEYSQSVAVRGSIYCNGSPSGGQKVKLYDRDSLEHDDLMKEGLTDQSGHFQLSGYEEELLSDIDPRLIILHECNVPCIVQMVIKVPNSFVSSGTTPKKTFDIGTIHLDEKLNRNFECIHSL